ncbi:hypothetical protein Lfu02_00460 [Longispora fulva]|nr:hypothetical protein Lfu02_00460 [Longispora fulva]
MQLHSLGASPVWLIQMQVPLAFVLLKLTVVVPMTCPAGMTTVDGEAVMDGAAAERMMICISLLRTDGASPGLHHAVDVPFPAT